MFITVVALASTSGRLRRHIWAGMVIFVSSIKGFAELLGVRGAIDMLMSVNMLTSVNMLLNVIMLMNVIAPCRYARCRTSARSETRGGTRCAEMIGRSFQRIHGHAL